MSELFDLSHYLKKYIDRYKKDLQESLTFLGWLNTHSPSYRKSNDCME